MSLFEQQHTPVRPGFAMASTMVQIAPYLASLLAIVVVLAWRTSAVGPAILPDVLLFTGLHLVLLSYAWRRGMRQTISLSHAALMAALPFFSTPYDPFAWVVYFIPVVHHAVIYRFNPGFTLVFMGMPWVMVAACRAFDVGAPVSAGTILFISLLALAIHLWLALTMDKFDGYVDQNEKLRLAQALENERERIGIDLHDGLGGTLTGLALRCRVALQAATRDPQMTSRLLNEIERSALSSLQQMRLSMQSLLKQPLTASELESVLRHVCAEVGSQYVVVNVEYVDTPPLHPQLGYHMVLLVSEALNNALRHGEAQHIEVSLALGPGAWSLSIRDDGKGLGENRSLRTIEKRADKLGATLRVSSAAGQGTTVEVRADLDPVFLTHP